MLTIFNGIHESLQMVRDLKNDHSCAGGMQTVNRRIEHLEDQFDVQVSREEFDKLQSRSELMANIEWQIEALQKKLLKVEKNAMRSNITIMGIIEDRNKDCIAKAIDDFQSVLKAEQIQVANAFSISAGTMLVQLLDSRDKRRIFTNVYNLKGVKNSNSRPYFVNNHLPTALSEADRRKKDIVCENKNLASNYRNDKELKKGELNSNKEVYKKMVQPLTVRKMLTAEDEEVQQAEQIKLTKGVKVSKGDCTFICYAVITSRIELIKTAYLQLCLKHASATHVACTYYLPGADLRQRDYQDDKEHGGGRTLLDILAERDEFNQAIFIERYYGGKNLGQFTYKAVKDAAKSASDRLPVTNVNIPLNASITAFAELLASVLSNKTATSTSTHDDSQPTDSANLSEVDPQLPQPSINC